LQWLGLFVDRNPGAIEVFHAGHKAIRLPDLAASGLYSAFWNCSSTWGAVQAFRPFAISGKSPRPHTVSRHFAPDWRGKRE